MFLIGLWRLEEALDGETLGLVREEVWERAGGMKQGSVLRPSSRRAGPCLCMHEALPAPGLDPRPSVPLPELPHKPLVNRYLPDQASN